nr:DNA-directed DNA polymerase [Tanacetum cinerariifolium]
MIFNIDFAMKHSYSNDDTCFSIDVIDVILEEDFDALLDEGSKILHCIKGTLLEEEIFSEFDKFMAMVVDENSESKSDTEELPFEKIAINTNYKIKTSLEEPLTDLELKPLPDNLEYVFLEKSSFLPEAFAWKMTDIPGICPSFCKHKIQLLDDKKLVVQKQIRLNLNMQEVVKKEIMKLLDTDIIYSIVDGPWVSHIHCVPKKGGITIVTNENDELVPTRTSRVGERMPFGLCNAPAAIQRCMLAIFHDMIKEFVEAFMDDFSVFGDSFDKCLNNIDKMLQHCRDAHLVLNWEKCHFMVKEGIVLGHKMSSAGLEVDKAKINVISKLLSPTNIKGKLTCAPVIVNPNWNLSFEVMYDASDFAVGVVLDDDSEVDNKFPGEPLMEINTKDEPWFADFANYLVANIILKGMTYHKKTNSSLTSNTTSGRNTTSLKYVLTG